MTKTLSNPFRVRVIARPEVPPDDGVMPAWRVGMKLYERKELPKTNIAYLDSIGGLEAYKAAGYTVRVLSYSIAGYCGGDADVRFSHFYMILMGGHSIGAMNAAMRWRFELDEPVSELLRAPTHKDLIGTTTLESGRIVQARVNLDGSPPSTHTYYGNQFIEKLNRMLQFGIAAPSGPTGATHPLIAAFDVATGQYLPDGTYPDMQMQMDQDEPTCKDPRTGKVYYFKNSYNSWLVWNPDTGLNVPGTKSPDSIRFTTQPVAVDTRRNRIFQPSSDTSSTKPPWVMDLATQSFQAVELGGLGEIFTGVGWGMPFVQHPTDPAQDAFYLANDHTEALGRLFRVNAETFVVDEVPVEGPAIPPTRNASGSIKGHRLYNKLFYLPKYGTIGHINDGRNNAFMTRVV